MSLLARSLSVIGLFAGLSPGAFAGPITFTFMNISYPPGVGNTFALGINDSGQIVGTNECFCGPNPVVSFLDNGGIFTMIDDPSVTPVPGGVGTSVGGINNAGQIVGFYTNATGYHGFLDSGNSFTTIDDPLGENVHLVGINDAGTIVGNDSGGAFVNSGGTFTRLVDPLDVSNSTVVTGINDSGQIVGYYSDPFFEGFMYSGGTFTTIGAGIFTGINNAGEVVGTNGASSAGFLYSGGTYITVSDPSAIATIPKGINDLDQIVGFYVGGTGQGFLATPSPEPSTLVMVFAAWFLGIAGYRTRKRLVRS